MNIYLFKRYFRVAYKKKNYLDFKMLIDDCFPYLYNTRNVSFAQWIYKEIHNQILISFYSKNPKDKDRKIFVNIILEFLEEYV